MNTEQTPPGPSNVRWDLILGCTAGVITILCGQLLVAFLRG
jgi:hypothetical protein